MIKISKESVFFKGGVVIEILNILKRSCSEIDLKQPMFIRISLYVHRENSDEEAVMLLLKLRERLGRTFSTSKIRNLDNQNANLILGEFDDSCLFNVSSAMIDSEQDELLKIEISSNDKLVVFDSSKETAYNIPKAQYYINKENMQSDNLTKQLDLMINNMQKRKLDK